MEHCLFHSGPYGPNNRCLSMLDPKWQHGTEPLVTLDGRERGKTLTYDCQMFLHHDLTPRVMHKRLICKWRMGDLRVQRAMGNAEFFPPWKLESYSLPKGLLSHQLWRGSGFIPTDITVFLTNSSLRQLSVISTVA